MNQNHKNTKFIYIYILLIYIYINEVFEMAKDSLRTKKPKAEMFLHSPTLSTVMMVEDTLKCCELMKIAELKRRLPKKVMHQTLLGILDYLQDSGKILIGTKGVLWIYNDSKKFDEWVKKGLKV